MRVCGRGGGCPVFVLINWLRWVTMATALAVLAVGYGASLTSLNALEQICIKSVYMLTYAQETGRTAVIGTSLSCDALRSQL